MPEIYPAYVRQHLFCVLNCFNLLIVCFAISVFFLSNICNPICIWINFEKLALTENVSGRKKINIKHINRVNLIRTTCRE